MGLLGTTFLVLLILQLTSVIAISWWLVFLPLIIGTAFIFLALIFGSISYSSDY